MTKEQYIFELAGFYSPETLDNADIEELEFLYQQFIEGVQA